MTQPALFFLIYKQKSVLPTSYDASRTLNFYCLSSKAFSLEAMLLTAIFLLYNLLTESLQECCQMCAGSGFGRLQGAIGIAAHDAGAAAPLHCGDCVLSNIEGIGIAEDVGFLADRDIIALPSVNLGFVEFPLFALISTKFTHAPLHSSWPQLWVWVGTVGSVGAAFTLISAALDFTGSAPVALRTQ